ncbi:MAG: NTP transferase domain-containing protein [Opitutales bacterium]
MSKTIPNLYGLVLAGGRSRRMGRDMATLIYRGQLQVDRAVRLLKYSCEEVLVSLREEQDNPTTDGTRALYDRFGEIGPFGGLLTAFFYHRDKSFFVLSCSMPFIDLRLVNHLIENRNPERLCTAIARPDGTPEPLCAIYENAHKEHLLAEAKKGQRDLDTILANFPVEVVQAPDPSAVDGVWTNDGYYEAQKRIMGV